MKGKSKGRIIPYVYVHLLKNIYILLGYDWMFFPVFFITRKKKKKWHQNFFVPCKDLLNKSKYLEICYIICFCYLNVHTLKFSLIYNNCYTHIYILFLAEVQYQIEPES